jgi:catechol 2,3-dioxygenase
MEPYRVPAGTGIGHVHLKVSDIDRALCVLSATCSGFDSVMRLGDSAAFISAGGYHHHIGLNTWHSRGGTPPPPHHTGPVSLRDSLSDAPRSGRAVRRVIEAGVRCKALPIMA